MRRLDRLVVLVLLSTARHSAVAQNAVVPIDTNAVRWSSLTERPRLQDTSRAAHVRFPSMLESAHLGGEVRVEMIVGRDGTPERSSIRVVSSTHDLFTSSVRRAVAEWRLTPPMVGGRAVRASVPLLVSFLAAPKEEPSRETAAIVIDSTGFHISLGREGIPRELGFVSSRADSADATIAVLGELLSTARSIKASAICVSLGEEGRKMFPDVFKSLRAANSDVRDSTRCPRTYASMILELDAHGKPVLPPKGALDPVWVSVSKIQAWTRDLYVMTGSVAQGTGTSWYRCQAGREPGAGVWTATCEFMSMTLSLNTTKGSSPGDFSGASFCCSQISSVTSIGSEYFRRRGSLRAKRNSCIHGEGVSGNDGQ